VKNFTYGGDILKNRRNLLYFFVVAMLFLFTSSVHAAPLKVAIVPCVNSTSETRDFVMAAVQKKFEAKFKIDNYIIIPETSVAEALAKSGYDPKMMELVEKDTLINVAKLTGADAVVAMEIVQFSNHRSSSMFSTSAKSEVKLKFRTYETAVNKYSSFQAVGLGVNKAVLLGVGGMGGAIVEGLEKAMDDGFAKFSF
jgi:hypothetical protein